MLYLLHGTDTKKAREKLRSLVDKLLSKQPDAGYFRFDSDSFEADTLAEHISGQGLFSKRSIVVLDNVFVNTEAKELVLERVKDIADSENIFVLLEESLDKKTLGKLERYAEKAQVFDQQPTTNNQRQKFNIFSLTDALGNRDSRKLWTLYQRALRSGSVPEELHGILFWQVKAMLLVTRGSTNGLKPFVISKARRFRYNKWF